MNNKISSRNKISIAVIVFIMSSLALVLLFRKATETSLMSQSNSFSVSPELLKQESSVAPFMRLTDDIIPATNRWFSPLIFSESQTIYAYPFSYKADSGGFEIGVPRLTSQKNAIFGIHNADIEIDLRSNSHEVSRYDDISVDDNFINENDDEIASVTITQGHPYIYIIGNKDVKVTLEPKNIENIEWQTDNKTVLFTSNTQRYGIRAETITKTNDTSFSVNLLKDDSITLIAIPSNTSHVDEYIKGAGNPLKESLVEVEKLTDKFETTYKLKLKEDRETILGLLPHHNFGQTETTLGSFDTLYGPLVMQRGKEFKYKQNISLIASELDLTSISTEQREDLKTYLIKDSKTLTLNKTDSYFGGKELYRAANLLQLAHQLNEPNLAMGIEKKLKSALSVWFSPQDGRTDRYFYYDNTLKGVVGVESSFGSEEFNDHHFHYGLFIYAASVLADHDEEFLSKYKEYVDLLVADIAAPDGMPGFPPIRTYDRFTGHSWASGYGNFADGNNQESSSEAINAWAAIYHWAKVTKNSELQETAQWLYGNEVSAAKEYWLKDQRNREGFSEFSHPFVSLLWQGKRDFATFFSPRPQAALGIQLIPMSPAHEYLDETNIQENISSVLGNQDNFSGQFGDYLVMYEALNSSDEALKHAEKINANDIDDGNSHSYFYAWLYSQSSKNKER